MQKSLVLNERRIGDVLVLEPVGVLDAVVAPEFEKKVFQFINKEQMRMVINLAGLSSISSAGLRVLLSVKKRLEDLDGKLVVSNVSQEIEGVIKICGFNSVLEIAGTEEDAVRKFL